MPKDRRGSGGTHPARGDTARSGGRLTSALQWRVLPSPQRRTIIGVVAGGTGLAASSLIGAVIPNGQPLITSVGDEVVSLTPAGVRQAAIGVLGTADKPVILLSVGVLTLVIAGLLGLAARHDRLPLALGGGVMIVIGLAATIDSAPAAIPAAVLAAIGAVIAAAWTVERLSRPEPQGAPARPERVRRTLHTPPRSWAEKEITRRQFALLAAVVAGAAAVGQGIASLITSMSSTAVQAMRATIHLPKVADPLPPVPAADSFNVPGLSPLVTENDNFYRVDTEFVPPAVDVTTWNLTIQGMVRKPITLTYDQLMKIPQVQADITLCCVSNDVGSDLISNARWQGVPLAKLLDMAGVLPGADQVVGISVDGFSAGFPTQLALDGRMALVAVGMNGQPLPIDHGFPARLVVPGLYGYVSATKWLTEIQLTTLSSYDAYWVQRGWAQQGVIVTELRIDVPQGGANVKAGSVIVAGVAWAQHRGISAVQVRVDSGPWLDAQLAGELSIDTWRQWRLAWQATAGTHTLEVRAADDTGTFQVSRFTYPFPGGATGYDQIQVTVA